MTNAAWYYCVWRIINERKGTIGSHAPVDIKPWCQLSEKRNLVQQTMYSQASARYQVEESRWEIAASTSHFSQKDSKSSESVTRRVYLAKKSLICHSLAATGNPLTYDFYSGLATSKLENVKEFPQREESRWSHPVTYATSQMINTQKSKAFPLGKPGGWPPYFEELWR